MSTKAKSDKEETKTLSASERKSRVAEIVRLMGDENTAPEDIATLAAELAGHRSEAKKAKEALSGEVHNIVQQIIALRRDHEISFAQLQNEMVDGEIPFPKADVVAYCQAQGWMPSAGVRATKAPSAEKEQKDALVIGKFKLADYGFTMPKLKSGQPASNDTELEWDFNKRYGGKHWATPFINAIKAAGIEKASQHFSEDFKKWLNTTKTGTHGRYAGKTFYENKKDFYAEFGMAVDPLTGEVTGKLGGKKAV